jgi:hypothetical protein
MFDDVQGGDAAYSENQTESVSGIWAKYFVTRRNGECYV